jgi:hypothetical protein
MKIDPATVCGTLDGVMLFFCAALLSSVIDLHLQPAGVDFSRAR